jgi:hypothetical protein
MSSAGPPTTLRTRIGMLQCLALLAVSLAPWPAGWARFRRVIESARSSELSVARREGNAMSYYEGLISGAGATRSACLDQSLRASDNPSGSVRFQEADVVRYLKDDFLQFELKPLVRRMLFGQPFATNAFGMHDDPVTLTKPERTFRIAILGSSMDMGWGVRYQDTYVNQFQKWLCDQATLQGPAGARRFEVLNFAVAAYSPLQRLEVLKRKVLAFQPDLVIYSATTLDTRLMEIHLCELFRWNVDLKYDFLRALAARAGLEDPEQFASAEGSALAKESIKSKLRPVYWPLYDATLGAIAAECRAAEVALAMVIIPRVGKADAPATRAEPVARLKALAAHHGLAVLDLSNTFDQCDPAAIEIAAWDDHPNAIGHRRLCLALAAAVVKDPELDRLLFAHQPQSGNEPSRPPRLQDRMQVHGSTTFERTAR